MKKYFTIFLPVVGGLVLIAIGALLLVSNFQIINLAWEMIIGSLLVIGSLVFLAVYLYERKNWWALFPAMVMLAIGANTLLGHLEPNISENFTFAIFIGTIGMAFWLVYLTNKKHWWAIIPGGVLWSIAAASLILSNLLHNQSIFFLGLAFTFFLVYILPKPTGKMTWALFPAAVLGVLGLFSVLDTTDWIRFVGPVAMLIGGAVLLFFAIRKR